FKRGDGDGNLLQPLENGEHRPLGWRRTDLEDAHPHPQWWP
ncbi:Os10g0338858, partial [Oryza sativa Japonica Group]